jgi:hypothetical protein
LAALAFSPATSALSACSKKERHRSRDMRRDLGAQRCEVLSEQRTHQHRQQI